MPMVLNPERIPNREKQILAGLFLSRFDAEGLNALGFESFIEAFNVLGYALGGRPASIKNYRDEFDPLFPNARKGWHKRPRRDYCLQVAGQYKSLDLPTFAALLCSFTGQPDVVEEVESPDEVGSSGESPFARRLVTGLAAERYFQTVQPTISEFQGCEVEDTTRFGCGYDFRLWPNDRDDFFAVEVKGIADKTGGISLTSKEYETASVLSDRFFLFVVKNFRETPFHELHANPLSSKLQFTRRERVTVQVSWLASA